MASVPFPFWEQHDRQLGTRVCVGPLPQRRWLVSVTSRPAVRPCHSHGISAPRRGAVVPSVGLILEKGTHRAVQGVGALTHLPQMQAAVCPLGSPVWGWVACLVMPGLDPLTLHHSRQVPPRSARCGLPFGPQFSQPADWTMGACRLGLPPAGTPPGPICCCCR